MSKSRYIISTDLDGTLVDHHDYSFSAAIPALRLCREKSVPVIINTSKTYDEANHLQKQLSLCAPLITENGSALYWPKPENKDEFDCKVFGAPRANILSFIDTVRTEHGWQFEGFNDWTTAEISQHTGLSIDASERANTKMFSEPFLWNDREKSIHDFIQLASEAGLKVLRGGRFYHLQGNTDKAKPLQWLMKNHHIVLCCERGSVDIELELIALGDNHNDISMLNMADIPVCVRSPVSDYPKLSTNRKVIQTIGFGPEGWSEAVCSLL